MLKILLSSVGVGNAMDFVENAANRTIRLEIVPTLRKRLELIRLERIAYLKFNVTAAKLNVEKLFELFKKLKFKSIIESLLKGYKTQRTKL